MMVYNSYNGASTRTSAGGREIALRMAPGAEWKINATTKFIVEGEWSTAGDMPIPADGIVISCGKDYADSFVDGLAAGDVVKLKIILSLTAFGGIKPDITDVIGGDVRILNQIFAGPHQAGDGRCRRRTGCIHGSELFRVGRPDGRSRVLRRSGYGRWRLHCHVDCPCRHR